MAKHSIKQRNLACIINLLPNPRSISPGYEPAFCQFSRESLLVRKKFSSSKVYSATESADHSVSRSVVSPATAMALRSWAGCPVGLERSSRRCLATPADWSVLYGWVSWKVVIFFVFTDSCRVWSDATQRYLGKDPPAPVFQSGNDTA